MLYKIKYTNRFGSAVRRREDGEVAKLHQSGPDYIRVGQITSEWARLYQSGPNYIRVSQITSEWARLYQSGPNYIRVGQITSERDRLHQSKPNYIRFVQITVQLGYNIVQGTITYNTTTISAVSKERLQPE